MATKTDSKPLDLSALTVAEADVPKQTRERKHKDNPFEAWLAESYESGTGRAVAVPTANASEVEYLIRRASNDLGIGARVVKVEDSPRKGHTTIKFQGKERKQRKTTADAAPVDA